MTDVSIYEYAGGAEAMRRLASAHYERCLTDPVLQQVFGTTPRPQHAEHLAAWLGEVFGGPAAYTEQHGGHSGLLRHHANLGITEPQRQRFVDVFMDCVQESGLPDSEPLRIRLREYLDWGSVIALEVSQPGAGLSTDQPVPQWGWGPAGPPA